MTLRLPCMLLHFSLPMHEVRSCAVNVCLRQCAMDLFWTHGELGYMITGAGVYTFSSSCRHLSMESSVPSTTFLEPASLPALLDTSA